ncbi:sensor histidine kinase [Eisenibacter elegans]|uniref:sensor histidine kinase n=1 Tax=Eisenibacter elegans TaxID=997 RepID=UPI000687EE7E|nr:histidine kinase [Eisenibacter elegans]
MMLQLFGHRHRLWIMLALGTYSYLNTRFTEVYTYYQIDTPPFWTWLTFTLITALIWEGNLWLARLAVYCKQRFKGLNPLLLLLIMSWLPTFFFSLLPTYAIGIFILGYTYAQLALPLKLLVAFGFRINLFLHGLNSIFYYAEKFRTKHLEAEALKKSTAQAQLQALRQQVNPHFLFNNLNVLSSLVIKDSHRAEEFIEAFAQVYRYLLRNNEKELVRLSEELGFIRAYAYLLEQRFGEGFRLVVDCQGLDTKSVYTIPSALQMLLENALKHNIASQKHPLLVEICLEEDQLVVRNTLQRKPVKPIDSTQIGLQNIRQRYDFLHQPSVTVIETETHFVVKLPLIQLLKPHEDYHY